MINYRFNKHKNNLKPLRIQNMNLRIIKNNYFK